MKTAVEQMRINKSESGRPLRALIVEDNPQDLDLAVAAIRRAGFALTFDATDSLVEFERRIRLRNGAGPYDVVLADYTLPNWTAIEALEIMRQAGSDIPLLVVTGSLGEERAVECIKLGATDFVLKRNLARLPAALKRALAEKALRDERARLQEAIGRGKRDWELTFDTVPDPIFLLGQDGRIQRANHAAGALLGVAPGDLIGWTCSELLRGGGAADDGWPHLRCLRSGAIERGDIRMAGKTFDATATPVHDATGAPAGAVQVMRDITERERAAQALRESEERYRLLFEANPHPMAVFDRETTRYLAVNPAALLQYGYSRDEFLAMTVKEIRLPQDAVAFQDYLRRLTFDPKGAFAAGVWRHRRKDGSLFDADIIWSAIEFEGRAAILALAIDVTQRRLAEQALRASETRLAEAQRIARLGDWEQDLATGERRWSDGAYRIFGASREQFDATEEAFFRFVHPEDRALVQGAVRETLESGRPYSVDHRIIRPDGEECVVHEQAEVVVDAAGKAVRLVGTIQDITEQKQAEQALRRSENRLRAIFEAEPECVNLVACDGTLLEMNPAGLAMIEADSLDQVRGLPLYPIIAAEHREAFRSFTARICRGSHGAMEFEIVGIKGTRRWLETFAVPLQDDSGGPPLLLGVTRDVTERKRSERALRESEQRFRELFENANDIIYTHDMEGNFTSLNKAGETITGYSREEMLRMNVGQIVAPGSRALARAIIAAKLAGAPPTTDEMEIAARDGRCLALEVSARLVYQDGIPTGVQGIARDVTDRKSLEQQLRQAQKMEAIGRLAGGVAHDFNNLLTVIKGYSALLIEDPALTAAQSRAIEQIEKSADRAASLTSQLLAFSRRQVLMPTVLDLNDVVAGMDKLLRRLIGEDVRLVTLPCPGLGQVKADRGQIEQVIMNLAVNARDAMLHGGKLMLETENVEIDENYGRQHASVQPGRYVMLAVSDNGCGMDAATQSRIFEPFFTTKGVGQGTGLGLSTVYGIVKQSGGHVWLYSEPGQGATFKIYLPRVDAPVESAVEKPRDAAPRGAETILLVEDDDDVRSLVRGILEARGYSVIEAARAAEALDLCRKHEGEIHLMLSDVVMPETGGRDLALQLAPLRPAMKVLFMSGYTDDAIVRHGVLEPGIAFLSKPFTADELSRKLRDVLENGAGRSASFPASS